MITQRKTALIEEREKFYQIILKFLGVGKKGKT